MSRTRGKGRSPSRAKGRGKQAEWNNRRDAKGDRRDDRRGSSKDRRGKSKDRRDPREERPRQYKDLREYDNLDHPDV